MIACYGRTYEYCHRRAVTACTTTHTLVVWRLDRRGRSLRHLIDTVTVLQEKGIGFKSLTESIDTTTSGGRLVFNIFASLAGLSGKLSGSEHKQGFIFSAELVRHYKPDPKTYLMPPSLLDLRPEQVMLVAAHPDDLHAARSHGLCTAYVPRPLEWGPGVEPESPDPSFDVVANDFAELAEKLGA